MEIRRLRSFLVLADHLHFGRAAQELHIAQPALSQQLRALERELGVLLVHRTRREVSLTAAGRVLVAEGRKVLRQVDQATSKTRAAGAGATGTLRVAYNRSVPDLGSRTFVEAFRARNPGVSVSTVAGWTAHNLELLRTRQADVVFIRLPLADAPDVESLALGQDELVLALPAAHPLATRRRVSRKAIQDVDVIAWPRSQGAGVHDAVVEQVWMGQEPRVMQEEPDTENILAAVAQGKGVAVLGRHRAERLKPGGVVLRRFSGETPYVAYGLAWQSDAEPVVARFVSLRSSLAADKDTQTTER